MPLYLKLVNLLKIEYGVLHNLPKEYKFSLGQDTVNRTWEILDLFIMAQNNSKGKTETIEKINYLFDSLKLRIRFLTELKVISLTQTATLAESLVEIGKMIGSWLSISASRP